MRPCFNMFCENGKEVEYIDDEIRVVTDVDCHICHGTGKVEDYCYCASTNEFECSCGWDVWYESYLENTQIENEDSW